MYIQGYNNVHHFLFRIFLIAASRSQMYINKDVEFFLRKLLQQIYKFNHLSFLSLTCRKEPTYVNVINLCHLIQYI